MKNQDLQKLEDSFLLAHTEESSNLNKILTLNLEKKMYDLQNHINDRLIKIGLRLYEDKGRNKFYNWHALFVCEPSKYKKVKHFLDTNNNEAISKIAKFCDVIYSNDNFRLTNLYKNLIQSNFYNKDLSSLELKNKSI